MVPEPTGAGQSAVRAAGPGDLGIWLCVLGPLRVQCGSDVLPVNAAKHRILLAALLLNANHVVSGDELADTIWDGAPPRSAWTTTRGYVKRLRQKLGLVVSARIVTRSPGYLIELAADELDLLRFSALYRQASVATQQASWETASALLCDAISLWQGPALADVPSDTLRREIPSLEEMRLQALDWRIDADLHLGRHAELVPELQALTAKYPLRERYHSHLMLALYRYGRQAEALACYHRARQVLSASLGVEPGAELRELYQRVLSADPDLAAGVAGRAENVRLARLAQPRPPVIPRQLPSGTRHFTGRSAELNLLDKLADEAARGDGVAPVAVITGMAGVGKTALAVHWAHRAAGLFPGGQLYVNLRGFDPSESSLKPTRVIGAFLEALGVAGGQMPASHEAREGLYRSMLAGSRLLIVLDNARDAAQVRPLLPGSAGCMVIVTSRRELTGLVAVDDAYPMALDVLTEQDAVDLLTRHLGRGLVAAESAAVERLAGLCGRLPLALVVASARVATGSLVSLAGLAGQIAGSRRRLDMLDSEDATASVRAAFSWSYRQLAGSTARMFRLLAVHPGPTVTAQAAASLAGVSLERAADQLGELSRAHLVIEQTTGRFCLHDLMRSFAIEVGDVGGTDDDDDHGALQRALDYYLHTACAADRRLNPARDAISLAALAPGAEPGEPAGYENALAWFGAEREVLLAVVSLAAERGFDAHAWQIPWAMVDFLERRGYWDDWVASQRIALRAARRLGDPLAQARASRALGYACAQTGLEQEAEERLASALALFRQGGDAIGQARTHQDLSAVLDKQDRFGEALRHDQLALDIYTEAGHRAGQASALNAIGWLRARLGDHRGAIARCAQALEAYRAVGNRRGEAAALDSLGYAHQHLGEHSLAIAFYQESLGLFRELGDRYLEADVLIHLGDVRQAAGGSPAAAEAWQQALAILEDLAHTDAAGVRARLAEHGLSVG